jgi:predicted CXXCH cytochrome family protein
VPEPQEEAAPGTTEESAKQKGKEAAAEQTGSKHGPYAARMCSACHDPNTNSLLLPRDKLCFKCHVLPPVRREHGPVAAGGCLVCHDPHRAPYKKLLVAAPREFCFYCHDRNDVLGREVHRNITVSCIECHNPHGSDNDFYLR